MTLRSQLFLALFFIFLLLPYAGQAQPHPKALEVLRLLEKKQGARVTVLLTDLETQTPIIRYRSEESFCPASLMKIPTTGAFLALKGADYRFQTPIGIRGQLSGDTLHGQLVLGASGDPSLASHYIEHRGRLISEIASLLQRWGIRRVTGGIALDLRGFPTPSLGEYWPDEDLNEYYGATVSGMNVADNYADLYLTSSADTLQAEGFIASLEIPTATDAFVSTSTQLSLDLTSHEDSLLVSGAVREGLDMRHRRMPFVDPPLYLGLWLTC